MLNGDALLGIDISKGIDSGSLSVPRPNKQQDKVVTNDYVLQNEPNSVLLKDVDKRLPERVKSEHIVDTEIALEEQQERDYE